MTGSQTQIIVALIAAAGTITAALIQYFLSKRRRNEPIKGSGVILSGTVGLVVGAGVGLLVAYLLVPVDPCSLATIASPEGTQDRNKAAGFEVSSDVKISWEPSDCVQIVQYYKNNKVEGEYKNVRSGDTVNIGMSGSGETEIKIFNVGADKQSDFTWVWVKK